MKVNDAPSLWYLSNSTLNPRRKKDTREPQVEFQTGMSQRGWDGRPPTNGKVKAVGTDLNLSSPSFSFVINSFFSVLFIKFYYPLKCYYNIIYILLSYNIIKEGEICRYGNVSTLRCVRNIQFRNLLTKKRFS